MRGSEDAKVKACSLKKSMCSFPLEIHHYQFSWHLYCLYFKLLKLLSLELLSIQCKQEPLAVAAGSESKSVSRSHKETIRSVQRLLSSSSW